MTTTQKFLRDLYLSYVNDYLTISYMAESHGMSDNKDIMKSMIDAGKVIHEEEVEHHKFIKDRLEKESIKN
jgi:hypothetical protein